MTAVPEVLGGRAIKGIKMEAGSLAELEAGVEASLVTRVRLMISQTHPVVNRLGSQVWAPQGLGVR